MSPKSNQLAGSKRVVGIDVGGTKIAYGLYNETYTLLARKQEKSRPDLSASDAIDVMMGEVETLLSDAGVHKSELSGIGAAFPSYIDPQKGRIIYTTNLPNWNGMYIRDMMQERINVRVEIDNDANAGALAEYRLGAGRGRKHMVYVTISTGIGGGIIIDGHIFHGSHGMAGEIGHVLLSDLHGFDCGCGNPGCAESISSGPNMARYAEKCIREGRNSLIAKWANGQEITTHHIAQALAQNDALAIETVDHAAEYLGRLFSSLYQILNIDLIVYGGGAVKVGSRLMEKTEQRFCEMTKYAKECPMDFLPAQLGDDVGIIGAALLLEDSAPAKTS